MDHRVNSVSQTCPFRRQNTKRTFSTIADAHREESPASSLFISHDDHYHGEHMAQRPRPHHSLDLSPRPHAHFSGDGLDFRSPVNYGSTTAVETGNNTIIDLTDDDNSQEIAAPFSDHQIYTPTIGPSRAQRLPRYNRDIIGITSDDEEEDVDDDEEVGEDEDIGVEIAAPFVPEPWFDRQRQLQPIQDEVQFIETRPRLSTAPRDSPAFANRPNPNAADPIDLTTDVDDDVVHQYTRARGGDNPPPPIPGQLWELMGDNNTHYLQRMLLTTNILGGLHGHAHHAISQNEQRQARRRTNPPPGVRFIMHPGLEELDYENTGFNLTEGTRNRRPTAKYVAPDPAEIGFTRSPGEDEIVVCPNCGDELGMGGTEAKQQIWVIKACGHAYCGECAQNSVKAARPTSKKGKGRATDTGGPEPLKTCAVQGCSKPARGKAMIHVYLGS